MEEKGLRSSIRKAIAPITFKEEGMGISVMSKHIARGNAYATGFFVGDKKAIETFIKDRLINNYKHVTLRFEKSELETFVIKIPCEEGMPFSAKGLIKKRNHEWKNGAVDFPEIWVYVKKDNEGHAVIDHISPAYQKKK